MRIFARVDEDPPLPGEGLSRQVEVLPGSAPTPHPRSEEETWETFSTTPAPFPRSSVSKQT